MTISNGVLFVTMATEPQQPGSTDKGSANDPLKGYDRVEETGVYQMLWDCKYCNTKKLLGVTHKFCPNCGAAQDTNARYFPTDEEAIAVEDHEYTGADKRCGNCGTANAAKAEFCTQCGSPLKDAKTVALRSEQSAAEGAAFLTDSKAAAKTDFDAQKTGGVPAVPKPPASKKWWYIGGAIGVGVAALIASFFVTYSIDVRIDSHSWEKKVKIEAFKPRAESAWCDTKPFDAYGVTSRREVRSHDQVADGETCDSVRVDRGNGSFSKERRCKTKYKSVPVYGEKCYYMVNRWGFARDIKAVGGLKEQPVWPVVQIRAGTCLGCEREAGRSEAFTLHMTEVKKANKKHDCDYKEAEWRAVPDGAVKKIKMRLVGGAKCDTLR